ncbi:MAG: hypothetical protein IH840_11120 [Candidatus Heimdallarchaeota archaeon]|nr:hypothetical protein [Candidatus Heimdallarchaeota archaeon]
MDDSSSPFNPFDGPLYDQDGTLLVENGESMSFEELLSIYWLLGVEGGCEATNDDECVVGSLL